MCIAHISICGKKIGGTQMTFELSGENAKWEILMAGASAPLWIKLDEHFMSGCGLVGCTSLKNKIK